jgi:hypothetical protein
VERLDWYQERQGQAMRLPRMTTRRWMILVGLVGLTLFGSIIAMRMSRRAKSYQSRASIWRQEEAGARQHLAYCRKQLDGTERAVSQLRARSHNLYQPEELARKIAADAAWWRANARHTEAVVAYCASMRRKYEHAVRYPWLAVPPDPPRPYWSGVADPLPDGSEGALGQGHANQDAGENENPVGLRTR